MKKMYSILSITILAISGCATSQKHDHARGSIVALDSPTEAHVCMNSSEVAIGEQVSLYKPVCKTSPPKGRLNPTSQTTCKKEPKGFAEVIETSDAHFIKVKAVDDAVFEEGFVIEKIKK